MEALPLKIVLAKMYADDNIDGNKMKSKWGDEAEEIVVAQKVEKQIEESLKEKPLPYSGPTYTQHSNGHFYLGWPETLTREPCAKNAVYVSHCSMTSSEISSEMSGEMSDLDLMSEQSEELEEKLEEKSADLVHVDQFAHPTYIGKFEHHAGWRDASKNWGFIYVTDPIKGMMRFIAFDVPPSAHKRGDTVRFIVKQNKRGKDAWKAVVVK